jgi:hypothetical protein
MTNMDSNPPASTETGQTPTITTRGRTKAEIIEAFRVAALTCAAYYMVDGVRTLASDLWMGFTLKDE